MKEKEDINKDIEYIKYGYKELKSSYELHNREWAQNIIDNSIDSLETILQALEEKDKEIKEAYIKGYMDREKVAKDICKNICYKEKEIHELREQIEMLKNTKAICPITNTSGIKCDLKENNDE